MNIQELDNFQLAKAIDFNNDLNPQLFMSDRTMRPLVRNKLLDIANHFREFIGVENIALVDIEVSGSNAAYSYTPHSDIDLHLIVDFEHLSRDEVYRELFDAKKYAYNDSHDIKIKGYDVELYVQDAAQPHHSLGSYSVLNNEWTRSPTKQRANLDDTATLLKYEKLKDLSIRALASDNEKYLNNVLDMIKKYRQAGLDKHGEFGPENLAFKMIRADGYFEKLHAKKRRHTDRDLSLEHVAEEDTLAQDLASEFSTALKTEAAYEGNIGFMEISQFYRDASKEMIALLDRLINAGKTKEAWQLIQKVTGTQLVGQEFNEDAFDHQPQDLVDVAEWLNTTPDNVKIEVKQEPISKFVNQIKEMYSTFDEFPVDKARTDKIVTAIKSGEKPLPVYVEINDPNLFVMEGRHRMVAFYLLGMKQIPVAYASKIFTEEELVFCKRSANGALVHSPITETLYNHNNRLLIEHFDQRTQENISRLLTSSPTVVPEPGDKVYILSVMFTRDDVSDKNILYLTGHRKPVTVLSISNNEVDIKTKKGIQASYPIAFNNAKTWFYKDRADISKIEMWLELNFGTFEVHDNIKESFIVNENGRIVKGSNTTVDVDELSTKREAAKLGLTVDKGGVPPLLRMNGKAKTPTNVMESPTAELKNLARAAAKKYSAGTGTDKNPHPLDAYHGKVWQQSFDKAIAKLPQPDQDLLTELKMAPGHLQKEVNKILQSAQPRIGLEFEVNFPGTGGVVENNPDIHSGTTIDDIKEFFDENSEGDFEEILDQYQSWLDDKQSEWADYHAIDALNTPYDEIYNKKEFMVNDYTMTDTAEEAVRRITGNDDDTEITEEIATDTIARADQIFKESGPADEWPTPAPSADPYIVLYYEIFVEDKDEALDYFRSFYYDSFFDSEMIYTDNEYSFGSYLQSANLNSMEDVYREWSETLYWTGDVIHTGQFDEEFAAIVADELTEDLGIETVVGDGTEYRYWHITNDESIKPDSKHDTGMEIVTSIMNYADGIQDVRKFIRYLHGKNAYTNNTTGLHINVSMANIDHSNLDYAKLVVMLGDSHILKQFGREFNRYAMSSLANLGEMMDETQGYQQDTASKAKSHAILMDRMKTNLNNVVSDSLGKLHIDKYNSVGLKDNRIEFRSVGGSDYLNNFQDILDLINRFIVAYAVAADPEAHKKEYGKKLYKLASNVGQGHVPKSAMTLFAGFGAGIISKEDLVKHLKAKREASRAVEPVDTGGPHVPAVPDPEPAADADWEQETQN